jgi:hypothetical protein
MDMANEASAECPHEPVIWLEGRSAPITRIPLSGARTPVTGYQDCQRVLVDGGSAYGPAIALYAPDGSHPEGAVVQIFAQDGAYAPLGIQQGFNCLYQTASSEAWMVPVGDDEFGCLEPRDAQSTKGTRLEVRLDMTGDFPAADVPEAVRWDWDPSRAEQYIGFRCGGRWCGAGRPGFTPSAVPEQVVATPFEHIDGYSPASKSEAGRVVRLKGWGDQQQLAEPDGRGGLVPGSVTGTIYPHPLLDRLDDRGPFEAGWIPVAYVFLDGDSPTYKQKSNFDAGVNRVYLRYGNPAEIIPMDVSTATCPTEPGWWTKVVSARGDVSYRCNSYLAHDGLEVPGSVRWGWDPNDEPTWVRCPNGCCTTY